MLSLQSLFNGQDTIGTGKHQPMKIVEVSQGIIQRAPVVWGNDYQCRQVKNLGPLGLEEFSGLSLLLGRTRNHHRAVLQRLVRC